MTKLRASHVRAALLAVLCLAHTHRSVAAELWQAGSFTRCLRYALQSFGVTQTPEELRAQMLLPFAPALMTNAVCFEQACLAAEPLQLAHVAEACGVQAEYLALRPDAWANAFARRYTRERMQHTLDDGGVIMADGDWDIGGPMRAWGVLSDISGSVFSGAVDRVDATLPGNPQTLVLLTPTNCSLAPRALVRSVLRGAIMHIHGSAVAQQRSAVLRGTDAVEYLALYAARTPWCAACGDASARCIGAVLSRWAADAAVATSYLHNVRTDLSAERARALDEVIAAYSSVQRELSACAAGATKLVHTQNGAAQAALGERVRALTLLWRQAAQTLGRAMDLPVPAVLIERPRINLATSRERQILKALPLFRDMQGGDDSFVCSLYVINYVAGTRDSVLWIKGLLGDPFVCPPAPPRDVHTLARELLLLAGYAPERYYCGTNPPAAVHDLMRRVMIDAINRGVPIAARGLDQPDHWGVIIGYKDFGRVMLARTPSDATRAFFESTRVPVECIVPAREMPRITDKELLQRMLRRVHAQYGSLTAPAGTQGLPALRAWHMDVRECALHGELPPWSFARDNGERWQDWRDRRRDAYRFLQLAVRRVPDASVDMLQLINTCVQQVNLLNAAQADNVVLRAHGGSMAPTNWPAHGAAAQAAVMGTLISNEVRIATILRDILDIFTYGELRSLEQQQPAD